MNTRFQAMHRPTVAWWALVALIVGGFVICAYSLLRQAVSPNWQDTEAYLGHSLYVAEHGGILGFLRDSFTGTFPITERHPLYLLVLAPFASRTAEFFWTAKIINLVTGVIALVTLIWMVNRRYGRGPALIAGTLYALSSSLLIASSHVNHESLFTLATLWSWWFLTQPASNAAHVPQPAIDPAARLAALPSTARWAIAGAFFGLAYLVKSPALLMGLAIGAAGLWYTRLRLLANPRVWVFLVATALLCSPLLVRNLIAFGTPIYEGVNSSIMWINEWSETGGEHSVIHYDRYGILKIERNGLPTASDYLQNHSLAEIAGRAIGGLYRETFEVATEALGPPFPRLHHAATVWGLLVLGFAVAGWWLKRKSWDGTLVFFWTGAFLVFFGWNHMFPEIRYLAPLVPVWIAFASHAMWTLALRLLKPQLAWRVATGAAGVLVAVAAGWTAAKGELTEPKPLVHQSRSYAELIEWLNENIEEGDRVLLGPTTEFYGLLWMVESPLSVIKTPDSHDLESFQRYLRERNVRYFVLNADNAHGTRGRLSDDLAPFVEVTPHGSLVEKKPLPGWRAVHVDPSSRRRFIIYESELVAQQETEKAEARIALAPAVQPPIS